MFPNEGPGGWNSLLLYFVAQVVYNPEAEGFQMGDGGMCTARNIHPVKEKETGETKHLFLSIFCSCQCLSEGLKGQEILK